MGGRAPAHRVSDTAEAAVSVADEWQGRGVGTALITRLAEGAREEGISRFTATCLASNNEVLEAEIELPASAETEWPAPPPHPASGRRRARG